MRAGHMIVMIEYSQPCVAEDRASLKFAPIDSVEDDCGCSELMTWIKATRLNFENTFGWAEHELQLRKLRQEN